MVLSYDKNKLKSLVSKSKLLGVELNTELLSKLYNNIIEFNYSENGLIQVCKVNEDLTSVELPDVPLDPYNIFAYNSLGFPSERERLYISSNKKTITTVKLPKSLEYINMDSLWLGKIKRLWLYDTTEIIGNIHKLNLEMIVILSSSGGKPKVIRV